MRLFSAVGGVIGRSMAAAAPVGVIQDMPSVGDIKMRAAAVEPGWVLCDGSQYQRVGQYGYLFAIIGTTYNVAGDDSGDNIFKFRVPQLVCRLPIGAGAYAGLTTRALGAQYGQERVTLTANNLAAHTHEVIDPGHGHAGALFNSAGSEYNHSSGDRGIVGSGATPSVPSTATGITVGNNDTTNAAVATLPPCSAVLFVIRYQP